MSLLSLLINVWKKVLIFFKKNLTFLRFFDEQSSKEQFLFEI